MRWPRELGLTRGEADRFALALGETAPPLPQDDPLAALVALSAVLVDHTGPSASAPTTTRLRADLLIEAENTLGTGDGRAVPARTPRPGPRARSRRPRVLVAAASAVLLVVATAATANASRDAMPGDALYAVKRGVESARAGLTFDAASRGRLLLTQAGGRLDELEGLVSQAPPARLPTVLRDFTVQAGGGSRLLLDAYRETGEEADVVAVRDFTSSSTQRLGELAATAPPASQAGFTLAADALATIEASARTLCVECVPEVGPEIGSEIGGEAAGTQDPAGSDSGDTPGTASTTDPEDTEVERTEGDGGPKSGDPTSRGQGPRVTTGPTRATSRGSSPTRSATAQPPSPSSTDGTPSASPQSSETPSDPEPTGKKTTQGSTPQASPTLTPSAPGVAP